MIKSRKPQLVIGLILACTCGLALCAEPNEPKTDVKLEINKKTSQRWMVGDRGNALGRGPIKPTHVAVFHVRRASLPRDYAGILQMLKTPTGKSLSEQQRQFLSASDAVVQYRAQGVKNHHRVYLYAVNSEDAKKMVQAYLEIATKEANSRMQERKSELQEYEETIAKARKELPQKEAELESVTVEYKIAKKKTHSPSSFPHAGEESKGTILEMNRVLDSLAIEIAGIEAKLSAIERIKSQKKVSSTVGLAKLEEIRSEQTVELAGALARKKAAIDIREREEEFYDLCERRISLVNRVENLKTDLRNAEEYRQDCEEQLANPDPEMLPPQLYQNKVTIYPVRAE